MCVTSLRLAVTPSMAPLGRLLVFYVRENGEGVADSLQFAVETFFENQVEHGGPTRGMGTGKRHPGLGAPGCPCRAGPCRAAARAPRWYPRQDCKVTWPSGIIVAEVAP